MIGIFLKYVSKVSAMLTSAMICRIWSQVMFQRPWSWSIDRLHKVVTVLCLECSFENGCQVRCSMPANLTFSLMIGQIHSNLYFLSDCQRCVQKRLTGTTVWSPIDDVPGEIPSFKLAETDLSFVDRFPHLVMMWFQYQSSCSFAFLDIGPLSKGHALVIPKCKSQPCITMVQLINLLFPRPCWKNAWIARWESEGHFANR